MGKFEIMILVIDWKVFCLLVPWSCSFAHFIIMGIPTVVCQYEKWEWTKSSKTLLDLVKITYLEKLEDPKEKYFNIQMSELQSYLPVSTYHW